MKTITPQQAFDAVKLLYDDISHIQKTSSPHQFIIHFESPNANPRSITNPKVIVDWPKGRRRWPPPQEPVVEKLSPERAFEAVKTLWPDTTHIELLKGIWNAKGLPSINRVDQSGDRHSVGFLVINWPECCTRWPQPQWRDAIFPDDHNKKARFSNDNGITWSDGVLVGWSSHHPEWIDASCDRWCQCQVSDE